jgi:hypothetical protein
MIVAALLQAALELTGTVLTPQGKPFRGALVEAGTARVHTDAKGHFQIRRASAEPVPVRISAPGMEPVERTGRPGEPIWALLQPMPREITVEVVSGSGYSSEEGTTSTLSRIDVYTTPGAAADVMQAAKGLPGVSNTTEGAELYVRGGKPDEVGIWLNGGHLVHPFHHPTTQGGIFSAVDTALVTKVDFIPGAFSSRYGDALSAVMDIATEQTTLAPSRTLLMTIPTQALALDQPIGPGLLRASARQSDTVLLDKWYGLAQNFDEEPISDDGMVNWQQSLAGGKLSLLGLFSKDHLATTVPIANLTDIYSNHSTTTFGSVQWTGPVLGAAGLSLELSEDASDIAWSFNRWKLDQVQHTVYDRVELSLPFGNGQVLEGGSDGDHTRMAPAGEVPLDLTNWNPAAQGRVFAYGFNADRSGVYLTWKSLLSPRWGLSLGGRADHYQLEGETTRDARATLSYLVREGTTLRLAGGSFHQGPPLSEVYPYSGNPMLKVMRATHALAALDSTWTRTWTWNLRVEAYRKDYDHLVVQDPSYNYNSTGRGYAQGLDLLLKATGPSWRGWIGYGYLDTRRKEDTQPKLGPVPESIPDNLTVMSAHTLAPGWEWATTLRCASGAPFTPVLAGSPDPNGGWDPVNGVPFSQRLPEYLRVDSRITHLFSWRATHWAAFAEVMNLLDRHNVSSYAYSPNFMERIAQDSYFSRRILVAGASIQW